MPRIHNWSVCDSFCAGLKFVKEKRAETWDFTTRYLLSEREFEFRFGAVMLLNHYLTEAWLEDVLGAYLDHRHEKYYAKMAIAWGLSQAFAFDPSTTLSQLEANKHKLDPFVHQKALQKILESRKVSPEHKAIIKSLKSVKGGASSG
ncbi:DNA alkylation repair enzyme [Acidaminobacter hydrogenoformans DSM 2784]|uniref:DNA alkylation repair enzyme n=1 Tax=Acidaminobacter hydrogenoformans DSM 2784 TaxID=1120920 RepID=A0A1G5S7S5_9FIRM|nr:DNA alkylation repair enzyme [Acidaminobacter hydrogenoformans DSM 2784]